MALQLLIGASGSGKTEAIFKEMTEQSIEHPDCRYLLIVPEQSTMELQREIVKRHPRHGAMNIDVVSFPRLAYHIFSELHCQPGPILDDLGKSMVLEKIMEENREQMLLLGRSGDKVGFIQELKSLLSEFFQYNVTLEQLNSLWEELEPDSLLAYKLQDLKVAMEAFEKFLQKGYCTSEQVLQLLSQRMNESAMIADSFIYLDEFTGYTPAQYEFIGQLLRYARKVTAAVTIDPDENFYRDRDFEMFALSKATIRKLEKKAGEANTVILPALVMSGNSGCTRFQHAPELAHLERYLFRYPYVPWTEATKQIQVEICRNPREEAEYVAASIQKLIMEQGYRYRDIAIVTGDLERYQGELEQSLQKRRMAYFIDSTRSIFQNPCMESIRAVLEMIEKNFTYESVFRYLKAGLSGISLRDISLLENYVIAFGIRGFSRWKKPFVRCSKGMTEDELEYLNEIREQLLLKVCDIRAALSGKKRTVREYIEALYDFMVKEQYQEQMQAMAEAFETRGELALAKSYQQVYPSMIRLLDQTVELLGDSRLPLGQLSDILDIGLDHIGLGVIPPSLDQIVIGDLERSRFHDIKVLFFLGMNEGIIPKPESGGGILTEADRELFLERHIELAPTAKQSVSQEQFYLYLNVTRPKEKLILTCARVGTDGKAIRPSYFIGRLQTLFPRLTLREKEEKGLSAADVTSGELAREYFSQGIRQYRNGLENQDWIDFYGAVKDMPELAEFVARTADSAFYENRETRLGEALARALYGTTLCNSVTRLEQYAGCAFAHFMRYGLGLEPRQEYTVRSLDIGNVLHQTVELFSREMARRENGWREIGDEQRDALIEQMVDTAIENYGLSVLDETRRDQYMRGTIVRIAKRTIWALQQQIFRGSFQPHAYELEFSRLDQLKTARIRLSQEVHMELLGKIDRVDRYEDDEHIYLKIIDYKSGSTSFQVQDMNYGLQIQLVVYLNAAMELEQKAHPDKQVIPAGIFYFNMKDPLIQRGQADYRERELMKALKMNGLVNSDREIVKLLEAPEGEDFLTLPVRLTKKGEFTKASHIASLEEFQGMCHHVERMAETLGKEMMEGNIAIEPYALGVKTACDYCQYRSICKFEDGAGRNSFRRLQAREAGEILRELANEERRDRNAMDS